MEETTMHELIERLPQFVTKAKLWSDAIAKNEVPTFAAPIKASGIFGLIS